METAIKKAIEGGYEVIWDDSLGQPMISDGDGGYLVGKSDVLLDPLFWQALGKSEGWPEKEMYLCPDCKVIGVGKGNHMTACKIKDRKYPYMKYWHSFIDHLAGGYDIDSFFGELLK